MDTKSPQENIRKPSPYLRRRIEMLDYEVESNLYGQPLGSINICKFFKNNVEYFESIMENSIDAMYFNYFSNIDDNSGEWNHAYLDMVDHIRNKYQDKIMKHYDDNCGSGYIPLKESIKKVLKEELNESTYLRRRVDMSSLDEEFYENLDIVTDRFLLLSSKKQYYCFQDFKDVVVGYIIEDFHYELTNLNGDDYPKDEVYEFLSNHYHDKIKDRYVEVFGGDINESENIRKVLKEETNYTRMLLRRLPTDTLNNIDNLFNSSLNYISKIFIRSYNSDPNKLSEREFIGRVIEDFLSIIGARHYLPDHESDEYTQWSKTLTNELTNKYKDKIKSMYKVLKK